LHLADGDKRLLVHCYSGCDPRDVLDALRRRGLLDDVHGGNVRGENISGKHQNRERGKPGDDERERARKLALAQRIWSEAVCIEGTPGALLARARDRHRPSARFRFATLASTLPVGERNRAVHRRALHRRDHRRAAWHLAPLDQEGRNAESARCDGRMRDPVMAG
jgi:hypothetical protein